MKIAVTSQNRKTVTEHAGACRKFWIFTVKDNQILTKQLLELPKEQSFRESDPHAEHPLDDIDVLITAGMGSGLAQRLKRKGIQALLTDVSDPVDAVNQALQMS
ncbi:NifB/NifX family molybdenum-iron cluster-binding protein [Neptunomonas sp.]|uniref:NifB/NifX family molybdenum-iron cluster-binding protein n=1 Tax=Neptunomonas sp. TaxID=1971898 RepID=UPI003563FC18